MRADYARLYRELYRRHWWWRAREMFILDVLRASQPAEGWGRILDVGCGDGLFFDQLSRFGEVEGVEPAQDLVSDAGPHRSRIYLGPFDESFRPGKCFSLVLMLDVLEHLEDPVKALRHAVSLLGPGGAVLVTVPAFNLLWTNHDVVNDHFMRYTRRDFHDLVRRAGMKIETEKYFFHWLFPVKLATRITEGILGLQPRPPEIPRAWVNTSLYWLCRLEQRTWGGLPLPFGSSLMVLGRRPLTPLRPGSRS